MIAERYRAGDLLVNVGTGSVELCGRRLDLPPLSFSLLVTLLRSAPEVVRRDDLVARVWEGIVVGDETLSQRVRLLREALGDDAERQRYVQSVRGWGYRMAPVVERIAVEPNPLTTVVVLPFSDLDGGEEGGPLCQGLAEEITSSLSRVESLKVIARTSSFVASRLGLDIRQIGERLGAGTVLEGSVRRSGSLVRVTVQLVRTSDGGHLWSERYDRELGDVLELEDEIADAVAKHLREDLADGHLARRRSAVDPGAYQTFLQGRYHFSRGGPEGLARAQACYEQATKRDPAFAPAFEAMAELHWFLGFFGGSPPRDAFALSTWYALRALELDDTLAETHALLAMLRKELDYNWPEVEREMARALELGAASPVVRLRHAISWFLPRGLMNEALAEVDAALVSDPLSLFVRWWSAAMAMLARQPGRALEEGRRMIAIDPSFSLGHWAVGMGLELAGDRDSALVALRRANELSGNSPFTLGFLALVLGRAGDRAAVRSILAELERASASHYVPATTFAFAHAGLGSWDDALAWLGKGIELGDPLVMPLKTYWFLDPARDDPRYLALLGKMNLA